jgi:hypothetical protein
MHKDKHIHKQIERLEMAIGVQYARICKEGDAGGYRAIAIKHLESSAERLRRLL